jgi:hypothetical protein
MRHFSNMRQTQYILYQCGKVACGKMARGIVACGISPPHRVFPSDFVKGYADSDVITPKKFYYIGHGGQ